MTNLLGLINSLGPEALGLDYLGKEFLSALNQIGIVYALYIDDEKENWR